MLATAPRTPQRDRIAIGGSIAIHLCVLAVALVVLPHPSFQTDDPDERILLASITRIQHRPAPAPAIAAAAVTTPVRHEPLPVIHAAVTTGHAARRLVVAPEHRAGTLPAPVPVSRDAAPSAPAPETIARPSAVPVAEAAATSAPAASATVAPVAQREEGIGNFGETYPAAIEPSARAPLFAGVNGVTVRVTVDESGHATSIEFLRGPADPAQRDELRARLLAIRFIPAACNGLRCSGTVELRN